MSKQQRAATDVLVTASGRTVIGAIRRRANPIAERALVTLSTNLVNGDVRAGRLTAAQANESGAFAGAF
jgi:hypothetical protein